MFMYRLKNYPREREREIERERERERGSEGEGEEKKPFKDILNLETLI